jgi:hypothetical protein
MTITAKFASTCTVCRTHIAPGTAVLWERGVQGVKHASLDTCRTAAAHRAAAPAPTVVDLAAVVAFLVAARDGKNGGDPLKAPRTFFAAPGNGELALSLAPLTGKNPGAVYVKLNGEYAGKVTADGTVVGIAPALVDALRAITADPAAAGAAYGRLTGRCSFCHAELNDEGSIAVGYGPKCAKNYGLPHKPRGSAKVTPVLAAKVSAAIFTPSAYAGRTIAEAAPSGGDFDGTLDANEARYAGVGDWTL